MSINPFILGLGGFFIALAIGVTLWVMYEERKQKQIRHPIIPVKLKNNNKRCKYE